MVSAVFRQAVREATGAGWEEWVGKLERSVDPAWSHEQIKAHICEEYQLSDEWGEWLAVMYGQKLGRVPVGVTKDAGVQIGVRRTLTADRAHLWNVLMSPRGLALWIGNVPDFQPKKGFEFTSAEGITGKLSVVPRMSADPRQLSVRLCKAGFFFAIRRFCQTFFH